MGILGRLRSRRWLGAIAGLTLISGGLLALPSGAATTQIDVKASGDAYVASKFGNRNFGSANFLRASSGDNLRKSYIKFTVPVTSGTLTKAVIFMKAKTANATYSVSATGNFDEKTVTYKNAPEVGRVIGSAKSSTEGSVGVDVTSAITIGAARTVSFAITSPYGLALDFGSRESKTPPSLVIVTETGTSGTTATTKAPATTSSTLANPVRTTTTTAPATTTTQPTTNTTLPTNAGKYGANPTPSATMTAQEFFNTRTCNNKIVTGTWASEGGAAAADGAVRFNGNQTGKSYTATNCVFQNWVSFNAGKSLATLNFDKVTFSGSMTVHSPIGGTISNSYFPYMVQFSMTAADGNIDWTYPGLKMPITIAYSYFYQPQMAFDPVNGDWSKKPHSEAMGSFGMPDGATFIGNTFIQSGPMNYTATAAMNWHGMNTTFKDNKWGWANGTPTSRTVYISGPNNVIDGGCMDKGSGGYFAPLDTNGHPGDPYYVKVILKNTPKDCTTGAAIPPQENG